MSFRTRMEVSSSMDMNPVQQDNYWRHRYRHDAIRSQSWTSANFAQAKRLSMTRSRMGSLAPSAEASPLDKKQSQVFFGAGDSTNSFSNSSNGSSNGSSSNGSSSNSNSNKNPVPTLQSMFPESEASTSSPSSPASIALSPTLSVTASEGARDRVRRRLSRRWSEPGSPADEHLRSRTLKNQRTFEALPSWDRELFAPMPTVPESRQQMVVPDCRPKRHSKVGDVETKTDPVKRRVLSDQKPTRLPKLPPGAQQSPWKRGTPLRLSIS